MMTDNTGADQGSTPTGLQIPTNPDGSQVTGGWNAGAAAPNPVAGYTWDPNMAMYQPNAPGAPPTPTAPPVGQQSAPVGQYSAPTPSAGGQGVSGGGSYNPLSSGFYTGPTNPVRNDTISPSDSNNSTFQGVNSDLYQQLINRAHQGTQVNPNDPNIVEQVQPFEADQNRSRQQYLQAAAEKEGQFGNLTSEARASAEKVGQNTGMLQASLVGKEIQAKRDEIQQALTQMGSQLTADQAMGLQKELGYLNNSLGKYGIDTTAGLTQQQINSNNDQFNATYGLNSNNQANFWDATRSGAI